MPPPLEPVGGVRVELPQNPEDALEVFIDGHAVRIPKGFFVLQACEVTGVDILPKPIASCAMPASQAYTNELENKISRLEEEIEHLKELKEFMKEWKRSRRVASLLDPVVVEAAPDSLDGLMLEMHTILASYDRLDMEAVVVKIMAMVKDVRPLYDMMAITLDNLPSMPAVARATVGSLLILCHIISLTSVSSNGYCCYFSSCLLLLLFSSTGDHLQPPARSLCVCV